MLTLLVLVAVAALSLMLLARLLGREERDTPPAAAVEVAASEQTGMGEPEWAVVVREQCSPLNCPNLKGNPRRPGNEPGCQVCAALFLERYGERLLKQQREGRNR